MPGRVWLTIVLAGAGTYAMRASSIAFAHRLTTVSPGAERLLRQIPPAALASIVVPALLRPGGELSVWQPRLAAGVVAAVVAWRTRNAGLTLAVGMVLVVLLQSR